MIAFTYFARLADAQGKRYETSWEKLVDRLSVARVVADKHDAPGISLATYRGDRRSKANVERVYAVGIDLDHLDALSVATVRGRALGMVVDAFDWERLAGLFAASDAFLHTTWSSTVGALRARVFLRLSRPCTGGEYERVVTACIARCEAVGLIVDRAARDPSRFWFLPSHPPGGSFAFRVSRGRPVDVDGALVHVPASTPPLARSAPPPSGSRVAGDVEARATAYVARCDPAVSGSGGHIATFVLAQRLVRGFGLDENTAYRLLLPWNERCSPPWDERALRRKISQAVERGTMPEGSLRDADRREP